MAQNLNLYLNLGSLTPVSQPELNSDDATAKFAPGAISLMSDAFGFKAFRYGRIVQSGGMLKGELASRAAVGTGTVTAAAGETNSVTELSDTGNWTVVNSEQGKICHITDDAGAAGAAPEGEVAVVVSNGLNSQKFDSRYPLTAAPAVGDTYRNIPISLGNDSADGDLAINVFGVVMADRTTGNFGWIQMYGYNPGTLYTTNAVTAGNPVVADAAAVNLHGCDKHQLWVGHSPGTIAADLASPFRSLCFIDLWTMAHAVAVG